MSKKLVSVLVIMLVIVTFAFSQAATERITPRIGIISAMENEIRVLLDNAKIDHVENYGGQDFHVGTLCGKDVVIVQAGIGKVLAASGAATMLNRYNISTVIFTGIAGGVGDKTKVLDIVVGTDLLQHDFGMVTHDGFVWNATESMRCYCDDKLVNMAYDAAVEKLGAEHVFKGTIVTGDQFIASDWYVSELQTKFDAVACEMEGAAVATVCDQYSTPFVVIRAMSDKADGLAEETYINMADIAANNSSAIVMAMLKKM